MKERDWPSIAVMGAGAVGCFFGGMLARAGAPVTLIGRPHHTEAIRRNGLHLESVNFQEHIAVSASSSVADIRGAEIILFSVKTYDTETTAAAMAPHLAPGAIVLSLQNGVDNVARIRGAARTDALAAVVYVAAEMVGPGSLKHKGRGDLIIGDFSPDRNAPARRQIVERLAGLFARAEIPCRTSENIEADLWTKLITNCAYNPIPRSPAPGMAG